MPSSVDDLDLCQPIYADLPGWSEDISGATTYEELPENAKSYLNFIEE